MDLTVLLAPLLAPENLGVFNQRFRVELDDGAVVEAVLYRNDTLCVSSQVGCAVACPFCASGKPGLVRSLTLDEMTGQVQLVRQHAPNLRRVTVSGVGEPLHNAAVVEAFVHWCRGCRLAPSLTTSGGPVAKLRSWFHLPHNGLTLSAHAGTERVRRKLVPHGPTLDNLFGLLREEFPTLSKSRQRRVSIAYLLIDGINDGDDEVQAFAERAIGVGASVYLYRLNRVPDSPFRSSDKYDAVYEYWLRRGLEVRRSSMARVEHNGGCGTLVAGRARGEVRERSM